MTAVRFRAVGQVQGVWFRAFTRDTAARFGLTGWVKNEPDGTVVGCLEGPDDAIQTVLRALRRGPPGARVDRLDARTTTPEGSEGFVVRR